MESSEPEWVERDPTGRYIRYKEVLGKGAFKTVYKGFDEVDGIEVAWNQVKISRVLRSSQDLDRLYTEINVLKAVKHENVMKFYNSWIDDEKKTINIITELFTSGNLRQFRSKHKNIGTEGIKRWARQILQGLEYLHSQNPPIAHRDLKCDNIFVNGNRGEVKIGDLGLAAVMRQPTAHSVIGTPEFMAPELYDEEYTVLVDIYSFGMCVLEMVTFDYPYSECTNPAQIYKKVTTGVKPLSLSKVEDPMVKQFIEKCLAPAAHRPSASDLLGDPYLCSTIRDGVPNLVELDKAPVAEVMKSEPQSMEIDTDNSRQAHSEAFGSSFLEIRTNGSNEFTLRAVECKDNSVELILSIGEPFGSAKNIYFLFYLDTDTALAVASEMVEQLELPHQDVNFIAEFIDFVIVKLVPDWKPSVVQLSSEPNNDLILSGTPLDDSFSNRFELVPPNVVLSTDISESDASYLTMESIGQISEIDLGGVGIQVEKIRKNDISSNEIFDSNVQGLVGKREMVYERFPSDISDMSCLSSLTDINKKIEDDEELSSVLASVESNYVRMTQELARMRGFALEDARKRWLIKNSAL